MNKTNQKQIIVEHFIRKSAEAKMLTIYEKAVIQMLASWMGNKNECWPCREKLAEDCSISVSQLNKTLRKLKQKKIIYIEKKKLSSGHMVNVYSFNEFWLSESDQYLSTALAANAFYVSNKSTENGSNRFKTQSNRAEAGANNTTNNISNNIKNNRPPVDNFSKRPQVPDAREVYERAMNDRSERAHPHLEEWMSKHRNYLESSNVIQCKNSLARKGISYHEREVSTPQDETPYGKSKRTRHEITRACRKST